MKTQMMVLVAFVGLVLGSFHLEAETNQVVVTTTNVVQKASVTNDAVILMQKYDSKEAVAKRLATLATWKWQSKSSAWDGVKETSFVNPDGRTKVQTFALLPLFDGVGIEYLGKLRISDVGTEPPGITLRVMKNWKFW